MKDNEIVFLNSPIYKDSVDDGEDYLPPLGQGYIVTQLKRRGINAGIIDCVNERMGIEEVVAIIDDGLFDNVALNIFSVNYEVVKSIVEKTTRKVNWYFGGKAIQHLWRKMLSWNWHGSKVVYTIGECDSLFADILLNKCVEPPFYRDENHTVYLVDKDSLYFPWNLDESILDRELFKGRAIKNHYGKWEQCLIGSRECIYNCAFCGGSRYANSNSVARSRSPQNISQEIKEILQIEPYIDSIRILDDLFLKNRESLLQAIAIFNDFPKMHWRGMAHVNSLLGCQDLYGKLKESGCDELFIGIESGSLAVRERIHKSGTNEDVIYVVSELLKVGIDVKGYFICGFPEESAEELAETVMLAKEIKSLAMQLSGNFRATAFQFRPYHGTELYDRLEKAGALLEQYHIEANTAAKKQYSFVVDNYSNVDNVFLRKSIDEIMNGAVNDAK